LFATKCTDDYDKNFAKPSITTQQEEKFYESWVKLDRF
jgi:hypothetical protein